MAAAASVAIPVKDKDGNVVTGQTIPIDAAGNVPVSATGLPLPAGAATEASLLAIKTAIQAQIDLASSLWTDNSGAFYVRRDIVNERTGTITVTFTDPTGSPATPGAGLKPASITSSGSGGGNTRVVQQALYDATASGTGYAATDILGRVMVLDDSTTPPTVVTSAWLNLTAGTVLSAAPTASTFVEASRDVAADTVVRSTAVSRSLIIPVKAASASVAAGGSGYVVNDTITNAAGVFTVSAVSSGAVTAVTAATPAVLTSLPATTLSQTATSGTGTGATLTPVYASAAVQLAPANATRRGIVIQPQGNLAYMSGLATATADNASLKIPADVLYESPSHHSGTGAISIIAAVAVPVPVYAREF